MTETGILLETYPETVVIDGSVYAISYGFKSGMQMDIAYHDERYTMEERLLNMLKVFYQDRIPENLQEAVNRMLWFYTRGKYQPGKEQEQKNAQNPFKRDLREFCFIQDGELILSAFWSEYGIQLHNTEDDHIHWWEFMALFAGLPENTEIKQYIYYRTCDLKGKTGEEKKRIKSIRNKIAIRKKVSDADMSPAMRLQKRNEGMLEYVRRREYEYRKGQNAKN